MIRIPIKKTQLHNEMKKQNTQLPQNDDDLQTVKSTQFQTNRQGFDATTVSTNLNDHNTRKNNHQRQQQQQQAPKHQADPYENLTPQQRIKKKKEEERRQNEEKMKEAAKQNRMSMEQAKMKKQHELRGSVTVSTEKSSQNLHTQQNSNSPCSPYINNNGQYQQNIQQANVQQPNSPLQTLYINSPGVNPNNVNNAALPTYYSQISNISAFGGVQGNNGNFGSNSLKVISYKIIMLLIMIMLANGE